jgi:hypothetical protein
LLINIGDSRFSKRSKIARNALSGAINEKCDAHHRVMFRLGILWGYRSSDANRFPIRRHAERRVVEGSCDEITGLFGNSGRGPKPNRLCRAAECGWLRRGGDGEQPRGIRLPGKLGGAEGGGEVGNEEDEEGDEDDDDTADGQAFPEVGRIACKCLLFCCHGCCPHTQLYRLP